MFALPIWKIMGLPSRYVIAISCGVLAISLGMAFINHVEDLLIYALVFNIPFGRFGKWLFTSQVKDIHGLAAQGIAVGMLELLLAVSYLIWFIQIFVVRNESFPKMRKTDYFALLLITIHVLSLIGAPAMMLAAFDLIYITKYILLYFFISKKVQRRHLPIIVPILLSALVVEAGLASYEYVTGNVGIGLAKGNLDNIGSQPVVPGFDVSRAAGTTNDSHTLALYLGMLLPLPLVFVMQPFFKLFHRMAIFCLLCVGGLTLLITFSRSGWLSFAMAASFAVGYVMIRWKQGQAILVFVAMMMLAGLVYPKGLQYVHERMVNAPSKLLSERYEINKTALEVWRHHLFLGCGPANYKYALEDPNIRSEGSHIYLVHNMILMILTEVGFLGGLAFFGMVLTTIMNCHRALSCEDDWTRSLALGIITGVLAFLLDGLTDPMFKQAVPYALFWTYVGIGSAFDRAREDPFEGNVPPETER